MGFKSVLDLWDNIFCKKYHPDIPKRRYHLDISSTVRGFFLLRSAPTSEGISPHHHSILFHAYPQSRAAICVQRWRPETCQVKMQKSFFCQERCDCGIIVKVTSSLPGPAALAWPSQGFCYVRTLNTLVQGPLLSSWMWPTKTS